ncbi:conjugal transfer protein TraG N-terminal domain-containing protein [Thauera aminoaromatica]|uniref:Conjugal transfer protein TraG n=1 Tax=Thauera aminoaromatica TaxID=164330 RepID=A0A5C7T7U2_THASP|nr:conjugal transfer protein TraG N-terminal domain-containing protein [Thauera aminoaromatica]TXH92288.1 MAG: conjugal transfer protein TraG [Thauera aminoaromatica]
MYTIYSYWDMAEIQAVLNAVAMVSGGDDFGSLLRVFGLIGLFVAVTYGFVRARGEDAAAYLVVIAIWYVGLFVPKVTVTIEDRAPATGAPVEVANVPLGLAFFASTTSHIGAWLTETYETNFTLPDDELRFDRNGIIFGSRILEEMRRSTITDPTLAQDITNFVKNCLNPELLVNPPLLNDLINEPDIWNFISTGAGAGMFNPGLAVTVFVPSASESRWVNCSAVVNGGGTLDSADSLNDRLTAVIAGEQSRLARILNPGRTAASANALIATQIEAAETLMLNASRTAAQGIRQNMMINLMRDTSKTIPQLLNDPSAVQIATAESMAAASSNSSYLVMAKVAEGALPKIRNVIHLVVLAVFPILMLLLIMAGTKGGLVLRSYGITLLWIHLWPPLYAVVNYISTMASAKSTVSVLAGIEGQTLGTAASLASTVLSDQAVAGLLSIAVPIMALALVKGGEVAMSGVVSSVMGPAQSAASRAGDSVGQGNIAMGSTSWGTHTASMMSLGKADTNASFMAGQWTRGTGRQIMSGDQGFGGMGSLTASNPGASLDLSRFSQNLGDYQAAAKAGEESRRAITESQQWSDTRSAQAGVSQAWGSVFDSARSWGSEASVVTRNGTSAQVADTAASGRNGSFDGSSSQNSAGSGFKVGSSERAAWDSSGGFSANLGGGHQRTLSHGGAAAPGQAGAAAAGGGAGEKMMEILRMNAGADFGARFNAVNAATRDGSYDSQLTAIDNAIGHSRQVQNGITGAINYLDGIEGSNTTSGGQQLRASLQEALKAEQGYSASLSSLRSKVVQDSSSTNRGVEANENIGNRILQEVFGGDIDAMARSFISGMGSPEGRRAFEGAVSQLKSNDPSLLRNDETPGATGKNDDVVRSAEKRAGRGYDDVAGGGEAAVRQDNADNQSRMPGQPDISVSPVNAKWAVESLASGTNKTLDQVETDAKDNYKTRASQAAVAADKQDATDAPLEAFGLKSSSLEENPARQNVKGWMQPE